MLQQSMRATTTQQLQMTPKLQQAIHLLQLSTQELTAEMQQIMLSNVFLEMDNTIDVPESQLEQEDLNDSFDQNNILESLCATEDKNVELDLRSLQDEFLPQYAERQGGASFLDSYTEESISLKDHLLWQLNLSSVTPPQKKIAEIIIDSINKNGFLEISCKEIESIMLEQGIQVSFSEIEKVLDIIQSLDPVGVGARNLQESLLIQLNTFDSVRPDVMLAKKIISNHMEWLASHKYIQLCRHYKVTQGALQQAITLIKSLNPRPGREFASVGNNYVIPDVVVEKKGKTWQVLLNARVTPKLYFNNHYGSLVNSKEDNSAKQFLDKHLQEARWLVKCVHMRNDTLLKVASYVVSYQQAFFEQGQGAMKPLILHEVAEKLGLHQSTISRITTNKYIQCPQGTFELKYFFTTHLNTDYGEQCSALATQNYIREIIKNENALKPVSDMLIAKQLQNFGINIARRTVAKYRELMAIPAAHLRKTLCVTIVPNQHTINDSVMHGS